MVVVGDAVSGTLEQPSILADPVSVWGVPGVTNYFGNSAIQQQAYDFKALDDAAALRSHILDMFERATHAAEVACTASPSMRVFQ